MKKLILRSKCERARGMSQVVECLPSKCEDLSSNPTPPKKKKSNVKDLLKDYEL
jgi:hypothetical protein